MSTWAIINTLNRLTLQSCTKRGIATNVLLNFRATPCLMAEPLKKKKRLDPAVIKAREDRKKKKIEKQIKRLEKNARQLKPIEECEVPLGLLDEKKTRMRSLVVLSEDELEQRQVLEKQWATYKKKQHLADVQMLDRILFAQQKALDELRKESEELYQEAMQIDFRLLPFKREGPLETPTIDNYESPDGDYADVSKKWE
ncbi:39S ribosomal protein L40, mitochondrial [Tribolium madens]|uniref:39S ribosomal protein L40, mitochondrial n=1 Tax=Tribolium madens TaxID=41895 RepID=UPI001CF73535|nr:39S ribosomal protein L40, mitochondrial [Tribolium madens]